MPEFYVRCCFLRYLALCFSVREEWIGIAIFICGSVGHAAHWG